MRKIVFLLPLWNDRLSSAPKEIRHFSQQHKEEELLPSESKSSVSRLSPQRKHDIFEGFTSYLAPSKE